MWIRDLPDEGECSKNHNYSTTCLIITSYNANTKCRIPFQNWILLFGGNHDTTLWSMQNMKSNCNDSAWKNDSSVSNFRRTSTHVPSNSSSISMFHTFQKLWSKLPCCSDVRKYKGSQPKFSACVWKYVYPQKLSVEQCTDGGIQSYFWCDGPKLEFWICTLQVTTALYI